MGLGYYLLSRAQVHELQNNVLSEQKLGDLRERSRDLEKSTGQAPMTWNEFNQANPQEKPKTGRNMLIGALVGAAVIGSLFMLTAAAPLGLMAVVPFLLGGVVGAVVSSHVDNANTRRSEHVNKYEQYLIQFEFAATHGKGREHAHTKTTHAAELAASRGQDVAHSR